MNLEKIHKKMVTEGKITSLVDNFKNMHSQITEDNIEGFRLALQRKSQHRLEFEEVMACIPELLKTGMTYERIYVVLSNAKKISMSVSFFQALGIEYGVYKKREVSMAVSPMEAEFLERKEEIIRRMAEGKIASKVHKEMYEDEKLNISFYAFRNYCLKHGIEMRKIQGRGKKTPAEIEFLKRKEEIIRRMAEGKIANKVHEEMRETGKLKMCYSTFKNYCLKHGIKLIKGKG
jgi:uncharacterized protein YqiB (DUF1249 family)